MAKFHVRYGAMNSGKSDTLIKTAYNYTERGLHIATIKPLVDTKGNEFIVARGGAKRKVDILAAPETDLRQALELFMARTALQTLNCVLIDEAQFLSENQIDQLYDVAKVDGVSVMAYLLKTNFKRKFFPGSKRAFELADNIEKIPTMCRCGSQAEFNCRKQGEKYVFTGEEVAIDGEEAITYDSLCGVCYSLEEDLINSLNHNNQTQTNSVY